MRTRVIAPPPGSIERADTTPTTTKNAPSSPSAMKELAAVRRRAVICARLQAGEVRNHSSAATVAGPETRRRSRRPMSC
jgi:hypothetical protein